MDSRTERVRDNVGFQNVIKPELNSSRVRLYLDMIQKHNTVATVLSFQGVLRCWRVVYRELN